MFQTSMTSTYTYSASSTTTLLLVTSGRTAPWNYSTENILGLAFAPLSRSMSDLVPTVLELRFADTILVDC